MAIPSLLSMAVDGSTLALYFSEPIKAVLPSRNRFQVFVNGVRNFASAEASLTNGDTIRLALTTAIPAGATVTVSYLNVNGFDRVGYGDIRSTSTNQVAAFFRTSATSNLTGSPPASVSISSSTASLRVGQSATITFSFSRNPGSSFVWNGSTGDVSVSGGTLSAISGSGLTRTATFTPTAGSSGTASITVGAGSYTDIVGNSGSAGTTPALSYDTLAPTLAISSIPAALTPGQTATITFSFSEDPGSSFLWDGTTGDVVVDGGTLSAISGSGLTRSATFTAGSSSPAAISMPAGSYTDAAGNAGGASFYVEGGTLTISSLGSGDTFAVASLAGANATVAAIGFTATSATSNEGTATLSSAGYTVNLGSATGPNGHSVTNTGAGATFTGSGFNDTLTGGTGSDTLNGSNGTDTLTGNGGADTFRYSSVVSAIISGTTSPSFERITDLAIGTDSLDGPNAVSAVNVKQLGDVGSSLTSNSITALLTTTNFLASGASTFTFGSGDGLRTFIALNDTTAGFSSTLDGIIEITGYTGILSSQAII